MSIKDWGDDDWQPKLIVGTLAVLSIIMLAVLAYVVGVHTCGIRCCDHAVGWTPQHCVE